MFRHAMRICIGVTIVSGLLTIHAFGQGSAVMIKNRAKETVNQNNVRQGVPPPSPPATRPGTPGQPTPGTPAPAVSQSQSIAKIKADILGFKTGSPATAEQKQQFIKNMAIAARSTTS